MKTKMDGLLNTELLQQCAIVDKDAELKKASQNGGAKTAATGVLSEIQQKQNLDESHQ